MDALFSFWHSLTASGINRKTDSHIIVKSSTQAEGIRLHSVVLMTLSADCQNLPQMIVIDQHKSRSTTYHFPLYEGFQVHVCNEFLRSLNTDADVTFITYSQYSDLIDSIFEQVKG